MNHITKTILITSVLLGLLLSPGFSYANEFDPNYLISNQDLTDKDTMTLESIQYFLETQGGTLGRYTTTNHLGETKTAAEIIYDAAQAYIINPKFLLVLLQKEQSLLTNPNPSEYNYNWATGYAVCDSCDVNDPAVQQFKGFGKQVDRAAWRIRYYFAYPEKFNFHPGESKNVDGQTVIPYNQATANLYNYTPHIHGNYNFWKLWSRWFAKIFPDGSLLQEAGQPGVWLIEAGKRRPFWSKTALISRYDTSKIVEVSRNDLNRYEIGPPIKFPNYSLLRDPGGSIYLLVNNNKKKIENMEVFRNIGYNPEEVIDVSYEEVGYYEDGRMITLKSIYPTGALLQDNVSGGVFYVEDGIKYPVRSREILQINFPNTHITQVSTDELKKYPTKGEGVKLFDGTLIKSETQPDVYVISNGSRRKIANEITFNQLGYKWYDIVTTTEKVLSIHPLGEELNTLLPSDSTYASN